MAGPAIPKNFRTVIVAAAAGNVIEWYDFWAPRKIALAAAEQIRF